LLFRPLHAKTEALVEPEIRTEPVDIVHVSKKDLPAWRKSETLKIVKFAAPVICLQRYAHTTTTKCPASL
jgi:hypothetical protein